MHLLTGYTTPGWRYSSGSLFFWVYRTVLRRVGISVHFFALFARGQRGSHRGYPQSQSSPQKTWPSLLGRRVHRRAHKMYTYCTPRGTPQGAVCIQLTISDRPPVYNPISYPPRKTYTHTFRWTKCATERPTDRPTDSLRRRRNAEQRHAQRRGQHYEQCSGNDARRSAYDGPLPMHGRQSGGSAGSAGCLRDGFM